MTRRGQGLRCWAVRHSTGEKRARSNTARLGCARSMTFRECEGCCDVTAGGQSPSRFVLCDSLPPFARTWLGPMSDMVFLTNPTCLCILAPEPSTFSLGQSVGQKEMRAESWSKHLGSELPNRSAEQRCLLCGIGMAEFPPQAIPSSCRNLKCWDCSQSPAGPRYYSWVPAAAGYINGPTCDASQVRRPPDSSGAIHRHQQHWQGNQQGHHKQECSRKKHPTFPDLSLRPHRNLGEDHRHQPLTEVRHLMTFSRN